MPVLIERTSKRLKLLRAVALSSLYVSGIVYLFFDYGWSYFVVLASIALFGISRLLTWWYHS